ncbi:PAS domain S-box protein [Antrihabitans spumae]|uniref:PAS domain S-box protein n=1 Tax=Antrihabitans spumae TaxID=3373370 RepID=A0ABW7JLA2_9NOCA
MRERRGPHPDTPQGYLAQLPALVLLDRLPVPLLAVSYDGVIVHANPAFEEMLGYETTVLHDQPIETVMETADAPRTATSSLMCGHRGRVITLRHVDGSAVRAVASESVLMRKDDPLSLVVFHDITEQLWMAGADHL